MDLIVEGHLFKPSGKWKYEVQLDYSGIYDKEGNVCVPGRRYIDPAEAALMALKQATAKGLSGVSLEKPGDYHLVVINPPTGFPAMVVSSAIQDILRIVKERT